MATSSIGDGADPQGCADGLRKTPGAHAGIDARFKQDVEDDYALSESDIRINPEIMRGVPPLHGLEEIQVIVVQPGSKWARWSEGIAIHLVGSGLVAVLAFTLGLIAARLNWG